MHTSSTLRQKTERFERNWVSNRGFGEERVIMRPGVDEHFFPEHSDHLWREQSTVNKREEVERKIIQNSDF